MVVCGPLSAFGLWLTKRSFAPDPNRRSSLCQRSGLKSALPIGTTFEVDSNAGALAIEFEDPPAKVCRQPECAGST